MPQSRSAFWPSCLLATAVALSAYLVHFAPLAPFTVLGDAGVRHPVSAAMIAILIGLVVRNAVSIPNSLAAGCKTVVRKSIPLAILCTGAGLNLAHLVSVGPTVLSITLTCVVLAVTVAYSVGRLFGLGHKTAMLLGAGTGICGNSAIVAVAPLIDAEEDDIALSVGAVNLLGLLAMLVLPALGGWFSIGSEEFGVWAGTSIHAVPQAVAAGFALGPDAGAMATLVKLVRVTMLAPMVFVVAALRSSGDRRISCVGLIPWFVWGFLAFAILGTFGLIPTTAISQVGKILLTLAMSAIGLGVDVRHLVGVGGRAVAAGLVSTVALTAASLTLITLLM